MSAEISWVALILTLPGIALLIVSTAARYAQVHDEIHHLIDEGHRPSPMIMAHMGRRALFFRNALVALYSSVAIFGIGAFGGAIFSTLSTRLSEVVAFLAACIGIGLVIFAALNLIRESRLSLEIIQEHLKDLENKT